MTPAERLEILQRVAEIKRGFNESPDLVRLCSRDDRCFEDVKDIVDQWCHNAEEISSFEKALDQSASTSLSKPRLAHTLASYGYERARAAMCTLKTILKPDDLQFLIQADRKIIDPVEDPYPRIHFESDFRLVGEEEFASMESDTRKMLDSLRGKPLSYSDICAVQAWHKAKELNNWKPRGPIWESVRGFYHKILDGEPPGKDPRARVNEMKKDAIYQTPSFTSCASDYHAMLDVIRNLLLKGKDMEYKKSESIYAKMKRKVQGLPIIGEAAGGGVAPGGGVAAEHAIAEAMGTEDGAQRVEASDEIGDKTPSADNEETGDKTPSADNEETGDKTPSADNLNATHAEASDEIVNGPPTAVEPAAGEDLLDLTLRL